MANKNNVSHYIGTYTDITKRLQAESDLVASETRLRTIIEREPDCITLVNALGRLIEMNPAGLAMIEADSLEQVVGLEVVDLVAPEFQLAFADLHRRVIAGESMRLKFKVVGLKGSHRWMDTHAVLMQDGGQPVHLAVTRDVTENQKADADLCAAVAAFEAQHGLVVTNVNMVILRVNKAFAEITGYSAEEAIGQTPRLFKSGRHDASFYRSMWDSINSTGQWSGEVWDRRKNGEVYPTWITIFAVRNALGGVTHYVGSHQDISDRKRVDEKNIVLTFFDQLTGLPNRTLLLDRLKQAITSSVRSGEYGALLFIDLDNFKSLNDTLGHGIGDLLLKQVSQRLAGRVRDGDTVARFGGDEFVVILNSLSRSKADAASEAESAAKTILTALDESYQLGVHTHRSTASIGATLFHGQLITMDDLMKQADMAMYRAKEAGRNALRFFDPNMETAVLNRVAMERDLREAIQEKQFSLHYQALVCDEGHVAGAEVLARWHHPERGMVPPDEFIPLAEATGVILSLGHWVLETACKQLALWAARPVMAHLTVAVNVSAHQFRQGDFVDQVLSVLKSTGANPHRLKLELTESFLVSNVEDTIAKMLALKAQGVGFAIDDFGTGFSSLAYLKRLPLNHLKIDRSFVRDVLIDPNDAAIAKTIVALAHCLGLGVIAEGVETQAQRDFLASSGCKAYQGYFFSRPLTVEGFEAFAFSLDPSRHLPGEICSG
jgi:diguanylate cyclase (GGDEF)-like protein/PAS domain S-box-containing protein